jgi:predicted metal-binding membrane protein
MATEESHQIAARIIRNLRRAGFGSEIVNVVPTDTAVLRRDRIVVVLALTFLTALAWSYLMRLSADMGGMDMSDFRIIPSGLGHMVPANSPWLPMEFAFVLAMWTVMMVAMMTPSAAPMFLMYARAGRVTAKAASLAATVWFVLGYFLVWVAFALLATLAQWALERTSLLDPAMASTNNILGGFIFVVAGTYQWTRLKDVCRTQCERPFLFLMRHGGFRPDAAGSVKLGLRHGAFCVGCCWALMALLLVGGVMNVLWISLLALFILVEKVSTVGRQIAPVAGVVLIAAGAWMLSIAIS